MRRHLLTLFAIATTAAIAVAPASTAAPPRADATDHRGSPASVDTRNEPAVAVSPTDPRLVVTAANDYYVSSGYVNTGVAAYTSHDGGHSFDRKLLPMTDDAHTASDPNLAVDRDGTFYAAYVAFSPGTTAASRSSGGVVVAARRADGRWSRRLVVPNAAAPATDGSRCEFADFPSIATGRYAGRSGVYVTWDRLHFNGDDCSNVESFDIQFSASFDHGRTWTRPTTVLPPIGMTGVAARVAADDRGRVFVGYYIYNGLPQSQVPACPTGDGPMAYGVSRSHDGGRHFTPAIALRGCDPWTASPVYDPVFNSVLTSYTGATYRLGGGNVVVNPATGDVLVATAVQDPVTAHQTAIVARSGDGGRTWHTTLPAAGDVTAEQQFPQLSVGRSGEMFLLYLSQLPGGWLQASGTWSRDGGRTWTPEQRVATVASHITSPWFLGFIGDYLGNTIDSAGLAHPVWTDLRDGEGTYSGLFNGGTIYTRAIAPPWR